MKSDGLLHWLRRIRPWQWSAGLTGLSFVLAVLQLFTSWEFHLHKLGIVGEQGRVYVWASNIPDGYEWVGRMETHPLISIPICTGPDGTLSDRNSWIPEVGRRSQFKQLVDSLGAEKEFVASTISAPLYSAVVLGLIATVVLGAIAWRRANIGALPGLCRTCGYNLTGNTSGRCPECGTAIGA